MKFLFLPGTDPYQNLATEDHLLSTYKQGDILLLWCNDNTIVVGLHQNTHAEINACFVAERGISVVRRRTGGGAVYHDLGNLNFSVITNATGTASDGMEAFTRPVVKALRVLGLDAQASGRNDITIDGFKVSGNAQALHKGRILHHGTLLFDSQLSVLGQALTVRPEKLHCKGIQSVRGRVANIRSLLQSDHAAMTMDDFSAHIVATITRNKFMSPLVLTDDDRHDITQLRQARYATREWNYGKSPRHNLSNTVKYPGGFLEVYLEVAADTITSCRLYGDFMALRPVWELSRRLEGLRYDPEVIASFLATQPVAEYFGSLTIAEIVDCLFGAGESAQKQAQ